MRNLICTCDRCGKEKKSENLVNLRIPERKTVEKVSRVSLCCATGYKFNLDLCDDCLASFRDWFEESPVDESQ